MTNDGIYISEGTNHIVIDFDLKDKDGSLGAGTHLHYIYEGDDTDRDFVEEEEISYG